LNLIFTKIDNIIDKVKGRLSDTMLAIEVNINKVVIKLFTR